MAESKGGGRKSRDGDAGPGERENECVNEQMRR